MTASTADRLTPSRDGVDFSPPVEAATKINAGTIVALNAAGNAVPGATSTTLKALGVAQAPADNSAGAAGDITVPVRRGVFALGNSAAADLIADSDYGTQCYIVDDQTVAKTSATNTRSVAGIVRGVAPSGDVWVEF